MGSHNFGSLEDVKIVLLFVNALGCGSTTPALRTSGCSRPSSPCIHLWKEAITLSPQAMVMRRSPSWGLGSAANALGEGSRGGIGGWWQTSASEDPATFGWFSLQFARSDFPQDIEDPIPIFFPGVVEGACANFANFWEMPVGEFTEEVIHA